MSGKKSRITVGMAFGRLTVIRESSERRHHGRMWWCRCVCGNEKAIADRSLVGGDTRSCGCYQRECATARWFRHGFAPNDRKRPHTYCAWSAMWDRCGNPQAQAYARYGGRGIIVCERWRDFQLFLQDMGECPEGLTLDRLDPNGDYTPENCRWATWKQQGYSRRNTHRFIDSNGREMCLGDVADYLAIPRKILSQKLHALGVL